MQPSHAIGATHPGMSPSACDDHEGCRAGCLEDLRAVLEEA